MQKLAVRLGGQPVRPLLDTMNPGGWKADIASFPGGEIGVVHAPDLQTAPLANAGIGPGLLRLDNGDIIAWSGLPLAPNSKLWVPRACDLPNVAPRLDGIFAAIGWSAAEQKLYVVTDFLGLQPLYIGEPQGRWTAATETKAFPYAPDPAGWGGFITCGHVIGRGSMTLHAERPRPASILTVTPASPASGTRPKVERRCYWQFPAQGAKEPSAEEAVDALLENAAAYQALAEDNVCLLSGGFDSRLILGLLYRMQVEQRRALILSHDDEDADLDGKLARMVARRTRTPVSVYQPDPDYFSTPEYLDYVWAIDGATPNLYLFIAQLSAGLTDTGAIWEGLIPAMAFKSIQRTEEGSFAAFRQQKCQPAPHVIQIFKPWVRQ
ncbi:MAG TPA: asparagine synthase-related protein, partial [Pedomonas sp.]|nr:asparagine synthase-related protein [Pedomonas sp.]